MLNKFLRQDCTLWVYACDSLRGLGRVPALLHNATSALMGCAFKEPESQYSCNSEL